MYFEILNLINYKQMLEVFLRKPNLFFSQLMTMILRTPQ